MNNNFLKLHYSSDNSEVYINMDKVYDISANAKGGTDIDAVKIRYAVVESIHEIMCDIERMERQSK